MATSSLGSVLPVTRVRGGESGHVYALTAQPDGTTLLDVVVVRDGKNLKGRLVGALLGSVGKGGLHKALRNTIKVIESRRSAV